MFIGLLRNYIYNGAVYYTIMATQMHIQSTWLPVTKITFYTTMTIRTLCTNACTGTWLVFCQLNHDTTCIRSKGDYPHSIQIVGNYTCS